MQKVQQALNSAVIICLSGHMLCCAIPTIASLIGIGSSIGLFTANLPFAEFLHDNGLGLLIFSGCIVAFSITATYLSSKIDCNDTGCVHDEVKHKKSKSRSIMLTSIATCLFVFNLVVYLATHH